MTPEQLIESVADKLYSQFKPYTSSGHCDYVAKEMLRIVLKAIEDGEVVEMIDANNYLPAEYPPKKLKLKPDFTDFLRGEK